MPRSAAATKIGFSAGNSIDADTAIRRWPPNRPTMSPPLSANISAAARSNFAAIMTAKARQHRHALAPSSATPPACRDPGQYTTARDMALLGMRLRSAFPQYFGYFSATSFNFAAARSADTTT